MRTEARSYRPDRGILRPAAPRQTGAGRDKTMLTEKLLAVFSVILALCLATLVVQARQSGGAVALTGADYAEIQQLSARYGQAIDSCADNGYEYARLYTPDGVFVDMWSDDAIKQGGTRWQ